MPSQDEWRGRMGATWAAETAAQDRFLDPLGRLGVDALAPGSDWRILDLGCGAGSSTLELAAEADVTFVGIGDLNRVLSRWNDGTPPALNAVIPEPASAVAFLGLAGVGLISRR